MNIAGDIEVRILSAVEAAQDPEALRADLEAFLPSCTIGVSDQVATACIEASQGRHRITFGRDFLTKELGDGRDLLFVLLHEVFHHVLGHLTASAGQRGPEIGAAANVAADILVNRAVCRRFFPGGVPLLHRLYPPSHLIGALLRAPREDARAEHREFTRALLEAGHPETLVREAWKVRYHGWFLDIPFPMLLGQVVELMKRAGLPTGVVFLGNHEVPVRRVPGLPWAAGTAGGPEDEDELEDAVEPACSPELARAVQLALVSDPWYKTRRVTHTPVTSPVFGPGRADWPFLALHYWPTLFHGPRYETGEDDQRAHVYVDASGSCRRHISRIYGLVLGLGDEVGSPIHLFSTVIRDVTLDEMVRGVCRTTHGTDFDCVFRHAMDHRYQRIVMITDGLGEVDSLLAEEFRAAGASLYLLLLAEREFTMLLSPLPAMARECWVLNG